MTQQRPRRRPLPTGLVALVLTAAAMLGSGLPGGAVAANASDVAHTGVLPGAASSASTTTARAAVPRLAERRATGRRARTRGRRVALHAWSSTRQLRQVRHRGTRVTRGRLLLSDPVAHRTHRGTRYEVGTWTSPWVSPGFELTELIASWNAHTPGKSFIRIRLGTRAGRDGGSWDTVATWAVNDHTVRRHTHHSQPDDQGRMNVDTWQATRPGVDRWRVMIVFFKPVGARRSPRVDRVGAVASALPASWSVPTSSPWSSQPRVLDVPGYSQMTHAGHYPRWGGGGEAWCSPTATSMVLAHLGRFPRPRHYSWVPAGHENPWIDYAARMTYDYRYGGAGNWPFNTAYAGALLGWRGEAFVTRLRTLREAERFIARGIPLIVSIAFGRGELDGAPISSTPGHLVVIVGFTAAGDVVVNDPAAGADAWVQQTYDRGQFENAWLPTEGGPSGGLTYVLRTHDTPMPRSRGNW